MNFRHVTLLTALALAAAMACGGDGGAERAEDDWPDDRVPTTGEQDRSASDRPRNDSDIARDTDAPVRVGESGLQGVGGRPAGNPPANGGSPGSIDDCLADDDPCRHCECIFGEGHANCEFSCS